MQLFNMITASVVALLNQRHHSEGTQGWSMFQVRAERDPNSKDATFQNSLGKYC